VPQKDSPDTGLETEVTRATSFSVSRYRNPDTPITCT
jgi:hypothetical protein